ncbi:TetR family transcriptional regulator [Nocardioides sp.]|uniref:TetR/AcrR family transcriptional regulator n=1 Tax=Nocardioides sp. TaxID=35761 RepID=UPI002613FD4B|nr:TetR family transcriptional regulator [Nocardioides sp.]
MAEAVGEGRQGKRAARIEAMTQAAATLLIDEGPAAITHRRVAEAAGVPSGSANYYFATSAELYRAAVERAEQIRVAGAVSLATGLRRRERTAARTARLLLETLYAPLLDDQVVSLRLQPILAATADQDLGPIVAESRPRLLAALSVVLERSGWVNVAHTADVELLARLADASLLYGAAVGDTDPIGDAVAAMTRVLELIGRPR